MEVMAWESGGGQRGQCISFPEDTLGEGSTANALPQLWSGRDAVTLNVTGNFL